MGSTGHQDAATGLLARMLTGLSVTAPPGFKDSEGMPEPDFSLNEIAAVGEHAVRSVLVLPSGDRFAVTVEWLEEESP